MKATLVHLHVIHTIDTEYYTVENIPTVCAIMITTKLAPLVGTITIVTGSTMIMLFLKPIMGV